VRLTANHRVAILLHQGILGGTGKTGLTLLRYSQAQIVAIIDQDCAGKNLLELTGINKKVPIVASVTEALSYQPNVLAIGIAPPGGALPDPWRAEIEQAIASGLSLVNGLHTFFAQQPESSLKPEQWIWNVRQEPTGLSIGGGNAKYLSCRRVLAVGTDMAIGKMSASLELERCGLRRGLRAKFLATGQAGLMIAGDGVALDAVRVDFAAGAVEQIVMKYGPDHDILLIEGQGSLIHPGSTATLPLLRGSQPTHLLLVHKAGQTHIQTSPDIKIPPLSQVIQLYEMVASAAGAMQPAKVAAIALNTSSCDEAAAKSAIAQVQEQTGLPCTDVVRFGADLLLDAIVTD
jgi:uncharacterized NAD-dependent epimerase/dehydratase family protein